uniref:Replication factor A C-terminal domain-containing protein n=1 Tax=Salix viminalis TaxID=40686 RepID=A0A6N2MUX7_SALVM
MKQGNAIQASAKGKNIGPFAASIIEGDYYQVYGFYTFENRYTNSVVSHEAIIDLKGEELRITLWGDVAKRFNDSDLANQSSPLIIVFAGFRITEFKGWWYHSCPLCTKSVSDKGASFKCIKHNDVTPVPWFRVDCIVTDGTDVTTFLMVGKTAENFFGSSAHSYVYDKGFIDSIPTPMINKLQKPKIFQLRFGTFRSMMNRCDIIVANVFDDITEVKSPQQHIAPELDDSNVPFIEQASA